MESNVSLSHSSNGSDEVYCEMIDVSTIQIGEHLYKSKFMMADTRFDVIPGTILHKDMNPSASYGTCTIEVGNEVIRGKKYESKVNG